jgi:beta-lactamase class A
MITRRGLIAGVPAFFSCAFVQTVWTADAVPQPTDAMKQSFVDIEAKTGGRLGVAVHDTSSGLRTDRRGEERFPLCSTFKLLAAAAILAKVDAGKERLDREIAIRQKDVLNYAPVTRKRAGLSMTLAELCAAAVTLSDNTAANLMLNSLGGPGAITSYARSLGDEATRLDRIEPDLNEALPGDPRDTTTPLAMAGDLHALLVGGALTESSRAQLTGWLIANKTGDARLRAGLPHTWRIGDKTGTGDRGTANDVAIAWRKARAPILIAVYLTGATVNRDQQSAALADVGKVAAAAIG